jgi:monofunctional biosynthetic peptidoglycan transglycosylase
MTTPPSRFSLRGLLRAVRLVAIVALILVLLPYLIAPLYRFIDPVSTVMLWRWPPASG